ncbi:MAG: hypothetical protein ACYS1A_18600, partial [Planctomycetota bacterium]
MLSLYSSGNKIESSKKETSSRQMLVSYYDTKFLTRFKKVYCLWSMVYCPSLQAALRPFIESAEEPSLREQGISVIAICQQYNVASSTFYYWLSRYEVHGTY